MAGIHVRVERLPHAADLDLPAYATPGAAGADLRAAIAAPVTLRPLERALIPTGLRLVLPAGFEAQVRPRSGLAASHGVTVLNAPGTIDSDYRSEIKVILVNLGHADVTLARGERIAQLVVAPVVQADFSAGPVDQATSRADGGFGSTGR